MAEGYLYVAHSPSIVKKVTHERHAARGMNNIIQDRVRKMRPACESKSSSCPIAMLSHEKPPNFITSP